MRRWIFKIFAVLGVALCGISVGLWIWGYGDARFLHANFANGHYDGDRSWSGSYLGTYRGQLFFELEQIGYAGRPTTAPKGRWAAEDAANVRTAAVRAFPFGGPLGFHFMLDRAESERGSIRLVRIGFPLWALFIASSIPVIICARVLLRKRHDSRCFAVVEKVSQPLKGLDRPA
jgi:hypothetical protein